ncbi:NifU family domain-containing protein [Cardiosporidium cionae]|uniref:NifU family domain-containing protein n=1 Tax=Cardiosporidium cionae TaxID=476202 RepID=A0ABQ7JDV1_9APIC|nr:NifU family domain-containing protein [Cardiosporidium cionae]|eukprot:KAF8822185.1 NifU family domain-containing protein [Cardiosporidium cionae]
MPHIMATTKMFVPLLLKQACRYSMGRYFSSSAVRCYTPFEKSDWRKFLQFNFTLHFKQTQSLLKLRHLKLSAVGFTQSCCPYRRINIAGGLRICQEPLLNSLLSSQTLKAERGIRLLSYKVENTPNPNAKMFLIKDCMLLPPGAPESICFDHRTKRGDFLTIVKERPVNWNSLEVQISKVLSSFEKGELLAYIPLERLKEKESSNNARGDPVTKIDSTEDEPDSDLEDIIESIKLLIDTRARPMVQDDGGDVEFIKFDDENGIVWVHMKGACEGCPSAMVTLQDGMAAMLQHFIPEVKGIRQCDENGDPLLADSEEDYVDEYK